MASFRLPCVSYFVDFALTDGYHYPGVLGRGHVCMYLQLSPCLSMHGFTYVVHRCWQEEERPYVSWGYRRLELPCGSSTVFLVACISRCLFVLWWFSSPHIYSAWLVPPPLLFLVYIVINNEQYMIIVMLILHNTCKANDSALYI